MAAYDPAQVRAAQVSPRFSVLARTGLDVAALGTWDANLLHEPRVLVPVDVQAYVVPGTGAEPALALPGPLSPGHASDPAVVDGPPPFTAGTPRPAGVHLSWAMPDALQRGRLQDPRQGSGGGLGMGALPDLWAVLRVLRAERVLYRRHATSDSRSRANLRAGGSACRTIFTTRGTAKYR